jgi:thiol-disulfide isomerase/thioredoxin
MRTAQAFIAVLVLVPFGGCYLSVPFDGLAKGDQAPPLTVDTWFNAPTDRPVRLDDLAGTPVLLEFWSKDCGPCRSNIPKIKSIAEAYGDALRVVTVHVSLDKTQQQVPEEIGQFVQHNNITFPVGIDQHGDLWKHYQFGYLPHAVILDESSRVMWSGNLVAWSLKNGLRDALGEPEREIADPERSEAPEDHVDCEDGVCTIQ